MLSRLFGLSPQRALFRYTAGTPDLPRDLSQDGRSRRTASNAVETDSSASSSAVMTLRSRDRVPLDWPLDAQAPMRTAIRSREIDGIRRIIASEGLGPVFVVDG